MASSISWNTISERFPVNQERVWLNNAGMTPASTDVLDAMNAYLRAYAKESFWQKEYPFREVKEGIQGAIGRLVACEPTDVAIIHNTSEGMNHVSLGMDLHPGDEILLLEDEYPSNVYPWEHWAQKGVRLNTVPQGDSPDAFLRNFQNALSPDTKVAALSAVHWCTGMPLPIRRIAELCAVRDVDLVVDGAQGVGHVKIDMSWGISYLAFSAWKWLLGPAGLGVLVVPKDKLSALRPIAKGTGSVVNDSEYFPYRDELKPNAERFMFSTVNFNDWVYFRTSLQLLEEIGYSRVMARLYELGVRLADGLRDLGFGVLSDRFAPARTAIIVAEHPEHPAGALVSRLRHEGVVAKERFGRVRFSPHVYLMEEHLDRALEAVSRAVS